MHTPEALCLCETVVSLVTTKGSDNQARTQEVRGPVGAHPTETFSHNAAGLSVVDYQTQTTRDRDGNGCRFTVPECISRRCSYDREKQIKLRHF
jgi:hypothetical protein